METHLKLSHLAPYLHSGLTGLWINGKDRIYKVTNICVAGEGNISFGRSLKTRYKHEINRPLSEFKPLLIPMSEFGKNLTGKGTMYEQTYNAHNLDLSDELILNISFEQQGGVLPIMDCYDTLQVLFSKHFDVFNLIPSGLALNKLDFPTP